MAADIRLANAAWEALLTAHSHLMRRFIDERVWRDQELSMREYDVLYTLSKCPEPARMGDLQGGVLLSQPALSRLVDRLEARGLVERVRDSCDGRAVRVALTGSHISPPLYESMELLGREKTLARLRSARAQVA